MHLAFGDTDCSIPFRGTLRYTLNDANRLDLEMGLMIQGGWNLGGPDVTPEYAAKTLTGSDTTAMSDGRITDLQPSPPKARDDGFYRDVAGAAYPQKPARPILPSSCILKRKQGAELASSTHR